MIILNEKTISWSSLKVANNKVHVWHASLEQPSEVVQKLESFLSEEERQRAERFRYQEHQQAFVVSRGILRNLLNRYTGIQPEQIQFKYNVTGKPFLAGMESGTDLSFNLSHSGLLVLYAFCWGRQVGIDVECIRPMEEMDQVAEMNLSHREYRAYKRVSEQDRLKAFYNCWSRKEAFVKAIGDGMSLPMREIEVSLEAHRPAQLLSIQGSLEQANLWTMHDLKTWDGYAAALVVEGRDHTISHKQWTYARFL